MAHVAVLTVGKGARQGGYEFEASLGYRASTCQGMRMEGGRRGGGKIEEKKKERQAKGQNCDPYQCKRQTETETKGNGCSKMACQNKCLPYF